MSEAAANRMERYLLIALACLAIGAFGASFQQLLVWLLWAPCALAAFWQIREAPVWVRNSVRNVAYTVLAATLLLGVIFMALPALLPAPVSAGTALAAGYGLAILATLFLLGQRVWKPAATLMPVAFGLLAVACFNPFAQIRALIFLAALMMLAYLALEILAAGRVKWPRAMVRFGSALAIAVAIGVGIAALLPSAQAGVESLTFQYLLRGEMPMSGFSNVSRLGEIESLKLSARPVMRIWTTAPRHMRGIVFTKFDGQTWVAGAVRREPWRANGGAPLDPETVEWAAEIPGNLYAPHASSSHDATGHDVVRTKVVQVGPNPGLLLSPPQTRMAQAPVDGINADAANILSLTSNVNVPVYGVVHRRSGEVVQPGEAPPEQLAEALQLPREMDPRMNELAARLSDGALDAAERVSRTVNHVESECTYSLNPGKFRTKQPVAEFLFEKKKGYCQYFASATAMLLRLQGVPARYVHGFNVSEGNRKGNYYLVRELDAHAWVEAYVPGVGWIEVDPTPAAEYESLHAGLRSGWFEDTWEQVSAWLSEFWAHAKQQYGLGALRWLWARVKLLARSAPGFVLAAALAVAAGLVWRIAKKWRRKQKAVPARVPAWSHRESAPELAELIQRLDAALTQRGCARSRALAPLEHLSSLPAGTITNEMRGIGCEMIDAYYRASFGGTSLSAEEITALKQRFERATSQP